MARFSDLVLSCFVVAYVAGSAPAAPFRPHTIERPFVAWHSSVNVMADRAATIGGHAGRDFGLFLRDSILGNTFLGRAAT